jgi:putative ABC transport system permease protein
MLQNYLTVAWRNLKRHKGYAFINVAGLGVGMACCLLITLYVRHELSYDRYHVQAGQIYRVLQAFRNGVQTESQPPAPEEFQVWGNAPVGPALAADFPEIRKMVRFTSHQSLLLQHGERRFQEEDLLFMDSTAFEVFSWKMLAGNPRLALVAPNSIVLTQSTARKYFGDRNPIGQTLRVENQESLTVTGLMEDVPSNSHFTFNGLISMSTFRKWRSEIFGWWGYVDFYTYLLVQPGTDIGSMAAKVPGFLKQHNPGNKGYAVAFEPMTDAYLYSRAGRQPGATGSLANVYIFASIAVFILVIACINFMNLSTARSVERAKEVGVRKAVGARQAGLMGQFLTESVLLSLLAAVLALGLAYSVLPALGALSGKKFTAASLLSWKAAPLLAVAAVVVGVLAGCYPAWVLARFRPVHVLKGSFRSSPRGVALRKGLVVFQFGLSMALITGTLVVFSQLDYLRTRDLGFQQDQMLVIDFGGDPEVLNKLETIKSVLADQPSVLSVAASRSVPGDFIPNAYTEIQVADGAMQGESPLLYEVDVDFIPHMGIRMKAGRAFSRTFPADTANSLLLNESAAKQFGYANPADVIGKRFSQWGREGTVIGVVKNFNFRSLHTQVEPLALRLEPRSSGRLSLRIKPGNVQGTVAGIEKQWQQLVPQRPFVYTFLDESFNRQYQADLRFGQVFGVFAGLAIFIACLGLFGLATFTAGQRTKEISIRKVLGASVGSIVGLLSRDFIRLVLLATLIATPVAWYAMNRWLAHFPYRVPVGPGVFVLAGTVALLVALVPIGWQSAKASLVNPVKWLRNE